MMWRLRAGLFAASCAVTLGGACALSTHGDVPASGSTSGGPTSAGGAGGASGPAGSGGSATTATGHGATGTVGASTASSTSGSVGASTTSSTSGTVGASVSSSTGTGGCGVGQKMCNSTCVPTDVPHGCADPSCSPCVIANGNPACTSGVCAVLSCKMSFGDCNHMASDGCEHDVTNDPNNCGQCGHTCSLAHATATCMSGTCQVDTCDPGFKNCGSNPSTGCETNITTTSDCGDCGQQCPSGDTCVNGNCHCNGNGSCKAGGGGTCRSDGKCDCSTHICDYGTICNSSGSDCEGA